MLHKKKGRAIQVPRGLVQGAVKTGGEESFSRITWAGKIVEKKQIKHGERSDRCPDWGNFIAGAKMLSPDVTG